MILEELFVVVKIDDVLSIVSCDTDGIAIIYGSKSECEMYIDFINNLDKTK